MPGEGTGRERWWRAIGFSLDEGPGAPDADLARIFDKFYRSPATAAGQQGTGLGLSITRGLVEAMGGAVEARARGDGRPGLVVALRFPGARP